MTARVTRLLINWKCAMGAEALQTERRNHYF